MRGGHFRFLKLFFNIVPYAGEMSKNITDVLQAYIDTAVILEQTDVLVANLNAMDKNGDGRLSYGEVQREGERLLGQRDRLEPYSAAYSQFQQAHNYSIGLYAKQHVVTEALRQNYQELNPVERVAASVLVGAGVTNEAIRDINDQLGQLDGLNVRLSKDYAKQAFEAIKDADGPRR